MYLIHETSEDSLKKILEEGQLKAAYLIENTEDLWGHGAGILYSPNEQKCIFFNVIDNLQKKIINKYLTIF